MASLNDLYNKLSQLRSREMKHQDNPAQMASIAEELWR